MNYLQIGLRFFSGISFRTYLIGVLVASLAGYHFVALSRASSAARDDCNFQHDKAQQKANKEYAALVDSVNQDFFGIDRFLAKENAKAKPVTITRIVRVTNDVFKDPVLSSCFVPSDTTSVRADQYEESARLHAEGSAVLGRGAGTVRKTGSRPSTAE